MDVSSIGSLSTALSPAQTGDAAAALVLKKALEMQSQSVLQLLQAVPQAPSNPSHLGGSVDVRA